MVDMSGSVLGPWEWAEICHQSTIRSIFKLGAVSHEIRERITPALPQIIQRTRQALNGICLFSPLRREQPNNHFYYRGFLAQMIKRIQSSPALKKVLDSRLDDLDAMVQIVKDCDLVKVFEPNLPPEMSCLMEGKKCISEKARVVREFLRQNVVYFSEVTEMQLNNRGLTSIPLELIEYCPNLQELGLSSNQIQVVPEAIGKLKHLKVLQLSRNAIQEFPDVVGSLENLELLNLAHNRIPEIPDVIGNLTHLKHLNLFDNKIQKIPDVVGTLGGLEWLLLHKNQIEIIPKIMKNLEHLVALNLSLNRIQAVPPEVERTLDHLRWVALVDDPIATSVAAVR